MSDTQIKIRLLSEPDIIEAGALDMPGCVEEMEQVFKLLSDGDYRMSGASANSHGAMVTFPETTDHPGMPTEGEDRRFMAMDAYLGGDYHMCGVKWYGSNIANRQKGLPRSIHTLELNDPDTGAPLAFMSANLISSYRTGAVPALGVKHLAAPDAHVVGVVGPGVMNKTALRAFMAVRPGIDLVRVKGRGKRSLDSYVSFVHENYPQVKVEVVESVEDAVRGADIVSLATNENGNGIAGYPFIDRAWAKPGSVICVPSDGNADEDWLASDAVRMVVDNYDMYETWGHELGFPVHEQVGIIGSKYVDMVRAGVVGRDQVVGLGDIVAGKRAGRDSDDQVVVYSIGGMVLEDIAWGTRLYRTALEKGIGKDFTLWDAPALA